LKTQTDNNTNAWILPIIIISQFCCTSLWFAGNSIINDLISTFNLNVQSLGYVSSSVQFGFIIGTLVFAFLTINDRFSPSKIFFISAVLGAFFNLGILYPYNSITTLLLFRFFTGFCLAGIYPVGMKIAADYFEKGLGKSLSFLVGALVLGTALPYLIKAYQFSFNWEIVIWITSILATLGGLLILLFVPDGPYQKLAQRFDASKILKVFKMPAFRSAAFGYFGHMWELYAFWTFIPIILQSYTSSHNSQFNIYLLSFIIIASGTISCVLGGFISSKYGVKKTAKVSLSISGCCCLLSPLFFMINSTTLFIIFLIVWGMAVISDSPLFSTLVAQNSDEEAKGTALTIVNCIGFGITILSIQIINYLISNVESTQYVFLILAIGPLAGLMALRK
jgi:MFS family permease